MAFSILLVDGCSYGLAFGTQGFEKRSVSEPDSDHAARFTRGICRNVHHQYVYGPPAMKTPALKFEPIVIGEESRTPAALCYLDTIVDPDILAEVKKRLKSCNLKDVLAAGLPDELSRAPLDFREASA